MNSTSPRSPSTTSRRAASTALLLVLLLPVAACGDGTDSADAADAATDAATDDAPTQASAPEPEPTQEPATDAAPTEDAEADGGGEVLEITAVDYAFDGVPAEVPAGTELSLVGAPGAEPHELIAFRLADDDDRPAMEILSSGGPQGPPPGEFAGVLIAPPGGAPGFVPDGPVVLDEPGRYLFVCFIPTGTTPEAFGELAASGGTSEDLPQTGPPHFVQGMVAELTVTG